MKPNTMRKIIYVSAFILGGCIISNGSADKGTKLPDEGKAIEVKSFKAIHASGVFNIYLTQGTKEGVVVKGYYPSDLKISNVGDTLMLEDTVHTHTGNFNVKTDIYVTLVNITFMDIESVGSTKCTDTLKLKNLSFESDGVGTIDLSLNADTVKGAENGVGTMKLHGSTKYAEIEDNGVGSLEAEKFMAEVLHVEVNGVGSANVYASKEIYIQSSGVGGVKYHGPAKVIQSESSGVGSVKHAD
jgi:hypothetical protein